MKAVVDTNVLVFDTFEDSEFHGKATSGLDSLDGWYLPEMVFHELVWFFRSQKIPPARAGAKVQEYLTNEKASFLPSTADDVVHAATRMKAYSEYNDLLILSAAKRLGVPFFTFDEGLAKLARRSGVELFQP